MMKVLALCMLSCLVVCTKLEKSDDSVVAVDEVEKHTVDKRSALHLLVGAKIGAVIKKGVKVKIGAALKKVVKAKIGALGFDAKKKGGDDCAVVYHPVTTPHCKTHYDKVSTLS